MLGMADPQPVVLYSRTTCHLCDEARAVIASVRRGIEFSFHEVLIDGDDRLEQEYGTRVPVITVGGREEFEYTVDPGRLRALLRARPAG